MRENHFGEDVAAWYDEELGERGDPDVVAATVDLLAELAGGGEALELGIGTGRIALPLAERGIRVAGIDLSEAMVAKLRMKPGSERIEVAIGDFATAQVEGQFSLVYLVFSTIMNLTTQDDQVACFANASAHLAPSGCFVVEVGLPQLQRLPPGETFRPSHVGATHLGFDEYDVAMQTLISHHWTQRDGSWQSRAIPFRYVWPSELDMMARLAGLTLCERWGGWRREAFTSESTGHVSIWKKPR